MNWAIVVAQIAASRIETVEKPKTLAEEVFDALGDDEMSRGDLAEKLDYSAPAVGAALKVLLRAKKIVPAGTRRKAGATNGRVAPLYRRR